MKSPIDNIFFPFFWVGGRSLHSLSVYTVQGITSVAFLEKPDLLLITFLLFLVGYSIHDVDSYSDFRHNVLPRERPLL